MTRPPAAVHDAMTAAIVARMEAEAYSYAAGVRPRAEIAAEYAQAAWDALVAQCYGDVEEREEWRCACGLLTPNHATANNQAGDTCGEPRPHRRLVITTWPEEIRATPTETTEA